jgi:hypothetical protein
MPLIFFHPSLNLSADLCNDKLAKLTWDAVHTGSFLFQVVVHMTEELEDLRNRQTLLMWCLAGRLLIWFLDTARS